METLKFLDRKNTNCSKWDALDMMFGRDDLHAMWVADMDIKVPDCVQNALHDYVDFGAIGYYKIPDGYYDAFINWEKKNYQLDVKREWIRFSPGVVSAFNWWVQLMSKPGDRVIVLTPVYYPFLNAVTNNKRNLISSDLVNTNGVYTVDFDDFEKKIVDNDVKIFILCSPHNPVGRVWSHDELKKMFDICHKHGVFVISDEIHQDLTYGNCTQTPSLSITEHFDEMVSITAPSKTFNLAGGQNSIVMIPDENLRKKWDEFVEGIRVANGNAFGYIAAQAAYEGGEEWLNLVRAQIKENADYVVNTFAKELPKIVVSPLEGTYLMWIDLRNYIPAENATEFVLEKCKLGVDFGDWFGGERFAGFIRMNLATSKENVEIGVQRLVDAIKANC